MSIQVGKVVAFCDYPRFFIRRQLEHKIGWESFPLRLTCSCNRFAGITTTTHLYPSS